MQTVIYMDAMGWGRERDVVESVLHEHYSSIGINFVVPSLSSQIDRDINILEEVIEFYDRNVKLIGFSMGGFMSIYLAHKYNLKTVLINPAVTIYDAIHMSLVMKNQYRNFSEEELRECTLKELYPHYGAIHMLLIMNCRYRNFSEEEQRECTLKELYPYTVEKIKEENFIVLLTTGNEELDYTKAEKMFRNSKVIIKEGDGHVFHGLENYFDDIDTF